VMRYAIYFTPPEDAPLTRMASAWLGRNAFSGAAVQHPLDTGLSSAEIGYQTAAARRYGFHATLKAPFHLAPGKSEAELRAALDAFVSRRTPFSLRLQLGRLDGFYALTSAGENMMLSSLANDVVTAFEPFRAPLSEVEMARRNPDGLGPAELKNLQKWGYPYVFDGFRFHMTLTGRVDPPECPRVEDALRKTFGPLLSGSVPVNALTLFVEGEGGAPFVVRSRHLFEPQSDRKSA
jgi:putative phosphonate metabolism protein